MNRSWPAWLFAPAFGLGCLVIFWTGERGWSGNASFLFGCAALLAVLFGYNIGLAWKGRRP